MPRPHWFTLLAQVLATRRIFTHDADQTNGTKKHCQPGLEINLTCAGRGRLQVGRHSYPLTRGTLVLIPEPFVHQLFAEERYVRSVLCVAASPSDPHPMMPMLRTLLESPIFRRPLCLQLEGGMTRDIRERISQITHEERQPAAWSTEMVLTQVCELLILTARLAMQPTPEQPHTTRLAESIATHISAHLSEDLTTKTVAAHFNISREYLSRLFHRHFGITYQEHVLRQRIQLARRLLSETASATPLLTIALEAGFQSHAHFSRLFRQHEGITPTQFRQLHHLSETKRSNDR